MIDKAAVPVERRGRQRRFDDTTERDMILDAAISLMTRNDGEVSVVEILAETGLSTRSFYRQFESKEALLVALVHREAQRVAGSMQRAIARTDGPVAAVDAWLDQLLDTFFEPARASRSALLTPAAHLMVDELTEIHRVMAQPLADALRAGHASGALTSPSPEADATSIFAVAASVAHAPAAGLDNREAVRAQVRRFAWPALGLGPLPTH